jgi:NADPH:quinone reductase-like Zn-dependent oxidoreductase
VRPGETVLVHAAGSGVGSAALQICKLFGAAVIATASTEDKLARARSLGADHAVLSGAGLTDEVKRLTSRRGVDVVVEHTGAATWAQSILACARGGRIVTCGASSGFAGETDLRHVFYRQLTILGSTMGSKGDLFEVMDHVSAGRLKPVVDRSYPLSSAREAHRRIEDHAQFGKIVLEI